MIIARANGAPKFDSTSVGLVQYYGGGVRLVVTDFYGKDRMEATETWVSFFAENKSDMLQGVVRVHTHLPRQRF